ncbi:TRAP transporter small permease [Anianabacter salinae]|uniref:TRAP transporter small permease n=1 Tax=Anianabacter salinae TaxID=2851023 RepID=UPI00225E5740|nr:TRAP transporter small permease [Anianabacter salinae]MBV0912406.1 TRAP transporter small permease [Anianabacter salinae]
MPSAVRLVGTLSTISGVIASFMILASVLITCQMIFVRAVLGKSTIWQTEAVIYLMIAATMIGLAYVQKLKGHVGVDLIPTMLGPNGRRIVAFFTLGVTVLMMGLMLYYAYDMWHFAWKRGWKSETVWAVPLWIPYLSVPLGFGLFLLQLFADLWMVVRGEDIGAPVPAEDRRH